MMNMTSSLNLDTGVFTAPEEKKYTVILTAMIKDISHRDYNPALKSYAQIFLIEDGLLTSHENYLLVRGGHIAELRLMLTMRAGRTLKVLVGHHIDGQTAKSPHSNTKDYYAGFYLEQVRFCIFPRSYLRGQKKY